MNLLRRNPNPDPIRYRYASPLIIRWARPEDRASLEALAELDEATIPPAPVMVGFVEDELWAAVSLTSGTAICDPFKPSADVARLLAERGRQLTVSEPRARFRFARRGQRAARLGLKARFGHGAVS